MLETGQRPPTTQPHILDCSIQSVLVLALTTGMPLIYRLDYCCLCFLFETMDQGRALSGAACLPLGKDPAGRFPSLPSPLGQHQ